MNSKFYIYNIIIVVLNVVNQHHISHEHKTHDHYNPEFVSNQYIMKPTTNHVQK